MTENEVVGQLHRLNGPEFEQTQVDGEGNKSKMVEDWTLSLIIRSW